MTGQILLLVALVFSVWLCDTASIGGTDEDQHLFEAEPEVAVGQSGSKCEGPLAPLCSGRRKRDADQVAVRESIGLCKATSLCSGRTKRDTDQVAVGQSGSKCEGPLAPLCSGRRKRDADQVAVGQSGSKCGGPLAPLCSRRRKRDADQVAVRESIGLCKATSLCSGRSKRDADQVISSLPHSLP